jgi:hypothetical protein
MNLPAVEKNLEALERFVVDNDDLLKLESRIGRFNLFDALGISGLEIRHSNFLSFLLDPAESHGQGQLFLKAFLIDMLRQTPRCQRPISPVELDGENLQGVRVYREWKHIDILITAESPRFVIVIENKVYSSEHSNQLKRYQEVITQQFPCVPTLFVYLTPQGGAASEVGWVSYRYADIHRIVERSLHANRSVIGNDIRHFIEHYLSLIETRLMTDDKLDDLCRRIYKNHRRALQLIFERVGSLASGVLSDLEDVLLKHGRWTVVWKTQGYLDFVPTDWLDWMPAVGSDYSEKRAWMVFRFELYEGRLNYYVQVNRMNDLDVRRRIVERLLADGEQFGFKRSGKLTFKDQYTRVSSKDLIAKFDEDHEYVSGSLDESARARLEKIHAEISSLPEVLKSLIAPTNA